MSGLRDRLKTIILPGFRTGHTQYVDHVKASFQDDCRWLDAGGGRRIFHDAFDGERELVKRAKSVVVCDVDSTALSDHASVTDTICSNLESIPLPPNSQDFITCGMVVEHLAEPLECFREFERLLDNGGTLIIHTVNLWGYPTLLAIIAKLIPAGISKAIIGKITGRLDEDIYPTYYRCNTARKVKRLMHSANLQVEVKHINHGPLFSLLPLYFVELLYIRITSINLFRSLRGQLLITVTKQAPDVPTS